MRVRDVVRFVEQVSAIQATEAIQHVNEYVVARAMGYKESAQEARQIIVDWEREARSGQPEPELSEEEKAKRAKFDLFRASVMGMGI